jgi:hypothetical protein
MNYHAILLMTILCHSEEIMKTVINDAIQQNIESIHNEEFHVDEERQLISMTTEGLISVINTVVKVAAEKVTDPLERELILKMCN